jgi:hypothetical protein
LGTSIAEQLAAYKRLVEAIDRATPDPEVTAALQAFEPFFCNNLTLVLDRYLVRRLRMVAGKDGNSLDEVELMSDSLMNNDGVLRANDVVKPAPELSVLKLEIGDPSGLGAAPFERLSNAFSPRSNRGSCSGALALAPGAQGWWRSSRCARPVW